ncbi:MAG: glycosyltransferase 87 family protein [Chloroflexota bacterium]
MRKPAFALIGLGLLLVLFSALADLLTGGDGRLGAAQLLGVEIGLLLLLIGIGLWRSDAAFARDLGPRARNFLSRLPASSPTVWAVATFLALYLTLFISPLLFSHPAIHYFEKYIPDAWVTRIGFDAEQTVTHVQAWLTDGTSPYADGIVPYSPLTLALFAPLSLLGYPGYYKFLSLLTIACFILCALLIPIWIGRKNETVIASPKEAIYSTNGRLLPFDAAQDKRRDVHPPRNDVLILLFFLAGLFSYGFQFELERGQFNVIAFACALTAVYLFHYHEKWRTLAYLLFSLAVQLKLYPAIFVLMLVEDWRDWKGNLKRFAGLGLFNFALLFVLGFDLGGQFISKMIARQGGFVSSRMEDISIGGFVLQLSADGFGLLSPETTARLAQFSNLLSVFLLAVFIACLLAVIVRAYKTRQQGMNFSLLAISTLCALVIPAGSFDYKLPLLAAPLALVLADLPVLPALPKRLASFALTVLLCLAYWWTQYPSTVKPPLLAKNFPALFVILLAVTALHFVSSREG